MWLTSSSSIDSSSDLSSTAVLGDGPARLLLEEDKREKKPYIWALVSHSSRENRRSPFSPFAFLISCETCPGSSFLSDCSPISNLEVRYCLIFSEKRTAPPFGLWSAHPSLKLAWEGSLPCLLITLVLSSSERVRDMNFSTQPRFSLSYPISVCCPTDLCSSISSTDLISRHMLVLGIPTLAPFTAAFCITTVMRASVRYSRSEAKILLFCYEIGGALMLNVNFIPRNEFARANLECLPHSEPILLIWKVVHGTELLEFLDI